MSWPLAFVGVVLVAAVMWDALVTTLAVARSSGPITGRLTHLLWTAALRTGAKRQLEGFGVALAVVVLGIWLVMLWSGWTLVFAAGEAAVVETSSGQPVGFAQRIYFAGYTLFTLGNGEYRPEGTVWQLLTVVALLNGLGLASLGITYLLPVMGAASERRGLAATISSLGERPDDMLLDAWNGQDFERLPDHLMTLGSELDLLAQRHLRYPVLHYFHSRDPTTAAAITIARLDEALTLLTAATSTDAGMPRTSVEPLRRSLTRFLDTLRSAFIDPSEDAPRVPSLDRLRGAGIPTVDDATFAERVARLDERRRALAGFVHNDGWTWDAVWPSPAAASDEDRETPKTSEDED